MATVISFEQSALAQLRERLGAAEEAREDLIAFARGHSGAVSSIHQAVLAAMAADGVDALIGAVTHDWPGILGIDSVALALVVGDAGFRADCDGIHKVNPAFLGRTIASAASVDLRSVERGHPYFGASSDMIRAQALIRFDCGPQLPFGLLLLGQRQMLSLDSRHGGDLLQFLGCSLAAMIRRWTVDPAP